MPATPPPGARRRRGGAWALILGTLLGVGVVASPAHAGRFSTVFELAPTTGPRQDLMSALNSAQDQFNNLELEAAQATLDAAIARAQGMGLSGDPALAPLLVLRGGLVYSMTGDTGRTLTAFQEAVGADYNVVLPIELRSEDLQGLLDQARAAIQPPQDAIVHEPPKLYAGQPVEMDAVSSVALAEGATLTLYYRPKGSEEEFDSVYMTTFGNLGFTTLDAAAHADKGLEYFFYVYDGANQTLANRGDRDHPMILELEEGAAPAGAVAGGEGGEGEEGGEEGGEEEGRRRKRKPPGKSKLPRVWINLGVGTGFGIARGTAELTYQQYTPGTIGATYGVREQACAVERWFVAGGDVAPDPQTFAQHVSMIQTQALDILPAGADELTMMYDGAYCAARHPVSTGLAPSLFHVTPEVGVRIGNRFVLSVFTRLQVVTGSKVFTEDPTLDVGISYQNEVKAPNPPGFRQKPPFTYAVGLKGKYFFGKDDRKFRLFGGLFAGYGNARLRVDMGFSNDRNGNSVPDAGETALHGQQDPNGNIIPETCVAVWPYNEGCAAGDDGPGAADRMLATVVRMGTSSTDARIDTVRIGPGFAGLLFGFNYQLHKNFALFAELDIGGWFPDTGSVLFDLNLGPAITF